MFRDSDLGLDLNATRRHVRFLMDRGINEDNAVLLAGGAAGDFSTMALDERISVAKAIVEEVDGKMPVAMGAQTTNTMELCRLVKSAQDLGADFVQISPPFTYSPKLFIGKLTVVQKYFKIFLWEFCIVSPY